MQRCATLFITLCLALAPALAERVRVGFEPFPPLINEDGSGYTIDMLRQLESQSELLFDIEIMSYSRAKKELKKGRLDLIGHTPHQLEEDEFYHYAAELDWKIATRLELFSLSPDKLDPAKLERQRIGTPYGNAAFMAEMTGIGLSKFRESNLESLGRMLQLGRIDAILFERASVINTLSQRTLPTVHYQLISSDIFAGLAVSRSDSGLALKNRLDALLQLDEANQSFLPYKRTYFAAPARGTLNQ